MVYPTIGFGNCAFSLRITDSWASHGNNALWLSTNDDGFGNACSTYAEKTFDLTNISKLELDVSVDTTGKQGTASVTLSVDHFSESLTSSGTIEIDTEKLTGNQTIRITITQNGRYAYADYLRLYLN